MIKPSAVTRSSHKTPLFLTQAVLASTLFLSQAGFATDYPPTPNPVAGVQTTVVGDINIFAGGQISGGAVADGILMDAAGSTVSIFAGALNPAVTAAAAGNGINVTGKNGTINVNDPGNLINVTGTGVPILIGADNLTLNNSGQILGNTGQAISLVAGGTNATITNQATGIIKQTGVALQSTIQTAMAATGLTLINAGTIEQSVATNNRAIQLSAPFVSVTNQNGGVIQQTLTATNIGAAIRLDLSVTEGAIINELGGTIRMTGVNPLAPAIAVDAGVAAGKAITISNAGTISSTATGAPTIVVQGGAGREITSITNAQTGLINGKNISVAVGVRGIIQNAGSTIINGLTNFGDITNTVGAGSVAIDFSNAAAQASIIQQDGTITGDVLLATKDGSGLTGNVFTMSGGKIDGNVVVTANAVGIDQVLGLSGGTITGLLDGSAGLLAKTNTFNISGGTVTGLTKLGLGPDIIKLSGGNLAGGVLGQDNAGSTININKSYTLAAGIAFDHVGKITVNNANTVFTLLGKISNIPAAGGVSVNNSAVLLMDAGSLIQGLSPVNVVAGGNLTTQGAVNIDFTGAGGGIGLTNAGTIVLSKGSTLGITAANDNPNTFVNQAGATLQIDLGSAVPGGVVDTGKMTLANAGAGGVQIANLAAGSFVRPNIQGFVSSGDKVAIITALNPADRINDDAELIQPGSATVSFVKSGNGTDTIFLTAVAQSFASLDANSGIARFLDSLIAGGTTDVNFQALLGALQALQTDQAVADAVESLAPTGANGSFFLSAMTNMRTVFDAVADRHTQPWPRRAGGLSSGDSGALPGGFWMQGLGGHTHQDEREDIAGFHSDFGGALFGLDWKLNDCASFGMVASYIKTNIEDNAVNPKNISGKNLQITGYGWVDYTEHLYLEAMLAYGGNDYQTNRSINIPGLLSTAAQADFDGHQWGAQADLGWKLWNNNSAYFTPFARLRYLQSDIDGYTETGAGFLNLTVNETDYNEFLGGLGLRLGTQIEASNGITWIPELTALLGYDFHSDGASIPAFFPGYTGGSSTFNTDGPTVGRTVFDLGLGVLAALDDHSRLSIKYNLELREDYWANAGYLQFQYWFN